MTAPAPPHEAVTAAKDAIHAKVCSAYRDHNEARDLQQATAAVAAAAPVIRAQAAAAERERIRLGLGDDEMLLITVQEVLDLLEAGDA